MKIQVRRDTVTNWSVSNPVLSAGEFGYETDTGKMRVGNGVSVFLALPALQLGIDQTLVLADNFNRTNSLAGLSSSWWHYSNYSASEYLGITANQAYRNGNPSSTDWLDGAVRRSRLGLGQWAQMDVAVMNSDAGTTEFTGSPPASIILRSSREADTTYGGATGVFPSSSGSGHMAIWAGIKSSSWYVWVGAVAHNSTDTANRVLVAKGTGAFAAGNTLRAEITYNNVLTLKYGGATLWSGAVTVFPSGGALPVGGLAGFAVPGVARVDSFDGGNLL